MSYPWANSCQRQVWSSQRVRWRLLFVLDRSRPKPSFALCLIEEIQEQTISPRQGRTNPRVVKKPRSKFKSRKRCHRGHGTKLQPLTFAISQPLSSVAWPLTEQYWTPNAENEFGRPFSHQVADYSYPQCNEPTFVLNPSRLNKLPFPLLRDVLEHLTPYIPVRLRKIPN